MADTKISALTAIASLATGDLVAVVDDPAGTPVTKKATVDQIGDYVRAEAATAELIRDTIGTALTAGSGISVTVNDGSDTITVAADGTAITALTAIASLATEDVFPVVDDPAGTPVTKKATMTQVATLMASELISDTAFAASWDGVTTDAPSKNATYDAILNVNHPGYVAGRYYRLHQGTTVSGAANAANRIYLRYFRLDRPITIDQMGARTTTTDPGSFKVAIYAHDAAEGNATGNPLLSTGNITCNSAGLNLENVANTLIAPGHYWSAIWQDNAVAAHISEQFSTSSTSQWATHVGDAASGNIAMTGGQGGMHYYDLTYGAWPDLTSVSFSTEIATLRGAVLFVLAA